MEKKENYSSQIEDCIELSDDRPKELLVKALLEKVILQFVDPPVTYLADIEEQM